MVTQVLSKTSTFKPFNCSCNPTGEPANYYLRTSRELYDSPAQVSTSDVGKSHVIQPSPTPQELYDSPDQVSAEAVDDVGESHVLQPSQTAQDVNTEPPLLYRSVTELVAPQSQFKDYDSLASNTG